jgi:hypothetical protein
MLLKRTMKYDDPALSEEVIYIDDSESCREVLSCPHCNEPVSVPLSPTLLKQLLHELTNTWARRSESRPFAARKVGHLRV